MFRIDHLDHVALAVKDLKRSTQWYQDMFGLERRYEEAWGEVPTMLCAGNTCIALFPTKTQEPKPTPDDDTIAMRHLAFRVNRKNFEQAQIELQQRGIAFEFEDHDIAHSIYFSDPDGYRLELTTYEL
jgi:catechol 2,3-dioxygenase-like lactoylglutathione lyase family enzyme